MQTSPNSQKKITATSNNSPALLGAITLIVAAMASPVFAQSTAAFTWQFQNGTTEMVFNEESGEAIIEVYLTIDGTISGWSYFLAATDSPEDSTVVAVDDVATLEQANQTGSGPVDNIDDFECFSEVAEGTNTEGIARLDAGTYLIETLTILANGSVADSSQTTIRFEPGQGLGYSAVADGATFYPTISIPTPLTIKWEKAEDTDQDEDEDETTDSTDTTGTAGDSTSTDNTGDTAGQNDSSDTDSEDANNADETTDDGDGSDGDSIGTGDGTGDGEDNDGDDQADDSEQDNDDAQDETTDVNSNGNTTTDDDQTEQTLGDRDVDPQIAEFCGAGSVLLMLLNLVVLMTIKLGRVRRHVR